MQRPELEIVISKTGKVTVTVQGAAAKASVN